MAFQVFLLLAALFFAESQSQARISIDGDQGIDDNVNIEGNTCRTTRESVQSEWPQDEIMLREAAGFTVSNCQRSTLNESEPFRINCRSNVRWPSGGFCQAISSETVAGYREYEVSVDLWNQIGNGKVNFGHPGISFNAKDINNYDFIYFRPHSSGGCYQIGWVSNGKVTTAGSAACPGGPPPGRQWFTVKVQVLDNDVRVYKDGDFVVEFRSHFSPGGAVGGIGANGYDNEIWYQNLGLKVFPSAEVTPPSCPFFYEESDRFSVKGCSTSTLINAGDYFAMTNAPGTSWPAGGMCQAMTRDLFRGFTQYKLSVLLYHEVGAGGLGHPGVLFNAKDSQNYDVVYFRPHSTGGCFQTGYTRNGAFSGTSSSTCPSGPPRRRTWFLVEVYIQPNQADVYMDGLFITGMSTRYSVGGYFGVLVPNGYGTTVRFRNLIVKVPELGV